jgi:hypothetical protein
LSIGPGGASLTSFPYFVISALHLICAGIYEKPHNLLPHLAILALSIGPGGASLTSFPYFVISSLHLFCAGL